MVGTVVGAVAGPVISGLFGSNSSPSYAPQSQTGTSNVNTQVVNIPSYLQPQMNNYLSELQQYTQTPYQPYTGDMFAPFTPYQNQAFQGIQTLQGAYQPQIQGAFNSQNQAIQNALSGYLNPSAIQGMMDPYAQNVIDTAKTQSLHDYSQLQNQLTDQMQASGAYGGDRSGVAQAEMARNEGIQLSNIETQGLSNAYNQATQNLLQQGSLTNQALSSGAINLGNLATGAQNYGLTGLQALLNAGGQQQQQAQNPLSFAYQQYQQGLNYAPTQLGNINQLMAPYAGATVTGTGTQTQSLANPPLATQINAGLMSTGAINNLGNSLGNFITNNMPSSSYNMQPQNSFIPQGFSSPIQSAWNTVSSWFNKGGLVKGYADGGSVIDTAPGSNPLSALYDYALNASQPALRASQALKDSLMSRATQMKIDTSEYNPLNFGPALAQTMMDNPGTFAGAAALGAIPGVAEGASLLPEVLAGAAKAAPSLLSSLGPMGLRTAAGLGGAYSLLKSNQPQPTPEDSALEDNVNTVMGLIGANMTPNEQEVAQDVAEEGSNSAPSTLAQASQILSQPDYRDALFDKWKQQQETANQESKIVKNAQIGAMLDRYGGPMGDYGRGLTAAANAQLKEDELQAMVSYRNMLGLSKQESSDASMIKAKNAEALTPYKQAQLQATASHLQNLTQDPLMKQAISVAAQSTMTGDPNEILQNARIIRQGMAATPQSAQLLPQQTATLADGSKVQLSPDGSSWVPAQ